MELVQEMLDTLPENVWGNKHLKWLDPANGMGNYPIAVFLRLFYGFRIKDGKYVGITKEGDGHYCPGLTKVIPNENTRRTHIVQHMLYMVELNSKNNAIAKRLFMKLAPGVTPNIIQMHKKDGFLADVDMKFPNGIVNTFDVVMGNPPYQSGAAKGKSANIPSANVCMNCHTQIKVGTITGEGEIAKIYAAVQNNQPIEWVRIHNLPDLAYFNHAQHVTVGGIQCQTCHGPIQEMDVVKQFSLLTMGWCIDCHRKTDVNTKGNAYYDNLVELHGQASKKAMKVEDIGGLECAKCHY
jgi:hypothetical protein